MRMVLATKKGAKPMSEKVAQAARSMSTQSVRDFAKNVTMKAMRRRTA